MVTGADRLRGPHVVGVERVALRTGRVVRAAHGDAQRLGAMAAQGPPAYWIINHRRHHALSDREGDLHSPYVDGERLLGFWRGLWHSHIGWSFDHELTHALTFGKDLLRDRMLARVNRAYHALVAAGVVGPGVVCGLITGSARGALLGALWGGPVRLFATYHATAAINSIAHRFGSSPYDTRDESRNNLLLVIPTLGEGWHNNHHAFPSSTSLRDDREHYERTMYQWRRTLRDRRAEAIARVGERAYQRYDRMCAMFAIGFHVGTMGLLRIALRRIDEPIDPALSRRADAKRVTRCDAGDARAPRSSAAVL